MPANKNSIGVGIIGLGTVGGKTAEVLAKGGASGAFGDKLQSTLKLVHVADRGVTRGEKFPALPSGCAVSVEGRSVVEDPAVQIVVELIGGTTVAKDLVVDALRRGKTVVSANKALIAHHAEDILAAKSQGGGEFLFEASVCGGIPIIRALREGLAGDRILRVKGIINGTCNYILTEMDQRGVEFPPVLGEAQRLGYAEADPSFDIDGIDAAHKLCVLLMVAFGARVKPEEIRATGISAVSLKDLRYARDFGYSVRLLGIGGRSKDGSGVTARVEPVLVSKKSLLSHVEGPMNAVLVESENLGTTVYFGAGAGAGATATAVLGDILEAARGITLKNRVPTFAFNDLVRKSPVDTSELASAFFLRFEVRDEAGVLAALTQALGRSGVSIARMVQSDGETSSQPVEVVMMTHPVAENGLNQALAALKSESFLLSPPHRIRVDN